MEQTGTPEDAEAAGLLGNMASYTDPSISSSDGVGETDAGMVATEPSGSGTVKPPSIESRGRLGAGAST